MLLNKYFIQNLSQILIIFTCDIFNILIFMNFKINILYGWN